MNLLYVTFWALSGVLQEQRYNWPSHGHPEQVQWLAQVFVLETSEKNNAARTNQEDPRSALVPDQNHKKKKHDNIGVFEKINI